MMFSGVHTLWAGRLLALSHQQAGRLGVGGAISRVVRTHYHADERGSASREVALQQPGENKFDRNVTYWENIWF